MGIETAVGRIHEILAAQHLLAVPPSALGGTQGTTAVPTTTTTGAAGSQDFASALASAQAAAGAQDGAPAAGLSATSGVSAPTGGAPAGVPTAAEGTGPFVPHGGEYGFFPAPNTNYTVGKEPEIAARLDALGKALRLHLVGLSGYRTPEHSVAVGGFANDPHTRGEAMDTPGIENVAEATLRQFGLTRPFPGAREADHIQLA